MKIKDILNKKDGRRLLRFVDNEGRKIAAEIKDYYRDGKTPKTVVQRSTGRRFVLDRNDIDGLREVGSGRLKGFGAGVSDDLTLGFNDEAIALVNSLSGDNYKDNVERRRAIKKARQDNNPTSYLAGNLAGLATPFVGFKTGVGLANLGKKASQFITKNILSTTRGGFNLSKPVSKKVLQRKVQKVYPDDTPKLNHISSDFKLPANQKDNWVRKLGRWSGLKPNKNQFNPSYKEITRSLDTINNSKPTFLNRVLLSGAYGAGYGAGSGEGWADKFKQAGIGAGVGATTGVVTQLFPFTRTGKYFDKDKLFEKRDKSNKNIKRLLNLSETNENQLARKLLKDDLDKTPFLLEPGSNFDKISKSIRKKEDYIDNLFNPNSIVHNKSFLKDMFYKLDNDAKNNFTLDERRILYDYFTNPKGNVTELKRVENILSPKLKQKETLLDYHEGISNPIQDNINYRERGIKNLVKNLVDKDYFAHTKGRYEKAEDIGNTLSDTLSPKTFNSDDIAGNTGRKIKKDILTDVDDRITRQIEDESTFVRSRLINETWVALMKSLGINPPDSRKLYTYLLERGDYLDEIEDVIKRASNIKDRNKTEKFIQSYLIDKNKVLLPYKLNEHNNQE